MSGSDNGKVDQSVRPPRTKGAKRMPRPRKPKGAPKMRPLRIEGVLVAAIINEAGDIVGEEQVAAIKVFAPDFDKLPDVVEGIWPKVIESRK